MKNQKHHKYRVAGEHPATVTSLFVVPYPLLFLPLMAGAMFFGRSLAEYRRSPRLPGKTECWTVVSVLMFLLPLFIFAGYYIGEKHGYNELLIAPGATIILGIVILIYSFCMSPRFEMDQVRLTIE